MSPDRFIVEFDKALRATFAPAAMLRAMPGGALEEAAMSDAERAHAAALMRVNHAGEICAQALYQGQALTANDPSAKHALDQAAREETEHLAWTEARIYALGGRKSAINPAFYLGALVLGALAGKAGSKWNLGFLAETERQVEAHLENHIGLLPPQDRKSRAVLEQMKVDEISHAQTALRLGGRALPAPVRHAMKAASKVMTKATYYL